MDTTLMTTTKEAAMAKQAWTVTTAVPALDENGERIGTDLVKDDVEATDAEMAALRATHPEIVDARKVK